MLAGHSVPELTVEEVEDLKRQRDELLKRKREKEELLASLGPEDVESLRLQRESLLATKKAKERELAQLIKKKDGLDKPSKGLKEKEHRHSGPVPTHLQNNVLEETRKQYLELKKEHKQDRQLMKDQKKRLEQAAHAIRQINDLQIAVNILLAHHGLETVPMEITDLDLEEPQEIENGTDMAGTLSMEVEGH